MRDTPHGGNNELPINLSTMAICPNQNVGITQIKDQCNNELIDFNTNVCTYLLSFTM